MLKRILVIIFVVINSIVLNAQWLQQDAGFDTLRAIGHICAVDTNVVWAASYNPSDVFSPINEYTMTTDGGDNWQTGIVTDADTLKLSMIHALDENIAYAVCYELNSDGGILFKTVDGGNNWNKIDSVIFYSDPKLVYFWNENDGVLIADPDSNYFHVYITDDAGQSWQQVKKINMPVCQDDEMTSYQSYSVVGDTFYFSGSTHGKIYVSKDKGKTWSFLGTPLNNVRKVIFKDSLNGLIGDVNLVINSWTLYETDDGGLTWNNVYPQGMVNYYDLCYVKGSPDAYVSSGYGLSQSADGGKNWTAFNPPAGGISPYYTSLAFVNSSTGWAGGLNFGDFSGGIYKYHGTPLNIYENTKQNITIDIYPNPGNGIFNIKLPANTGTVSLAVYDLLGKQLFNADHYEEPLNLTNLKDGIYIIKLVIDNKVYQNKIIIRNPF